MGTASITVRVDEQLKSQLQELVSDLGMDVTTFFTMAAKQAVREQGLPFVPKKTSGLYNKKAYQLALDNTKYNEDGRAIVSRDDEWVAETEWDDLFVQMKNKRGI